MDGLDLNQWILRDSDSTGYESYYHVSRPGFFIRKKTTVTSVDTYTYYFDFNNTRSAADTVTAMTAAWTGRAGLTYGEYPVVFPAGIFK